MKRLAQQLAALATLLPGCAWAFQPLLTDDTGTQGAGGNQVEVAYNRTSDKAAGSRVLTHDMPLVLMRGFTDALDIYIGITRQRIVPDAPSASERGWGNTTVGAKWRFYDNQASKLSFALKPEIQFPVSQNRENRGLGAARASYGVGLLMTQETGFGSLLANLVANRVNYADDTLNAAERRTQYRLSVAPVWNVSEQWKLALDAGITTNPDRTANARMGYIEWGAIYSPSKDFDLALGVIRNVADGNVSTLQATLGFTWRFK
jgi:hypothetical protein